MFGSQKHNITKSNLEPRLQGEKGQEKINVNGFLTSFKNPQLWQKEN